MIAALYARKSAAEHDKHDQARRARASPETVTRRFALSAEHSRLRVGT
jgi:hypothetical protein